MEFVKLKSKNGEINYVNISNIINIRHLPKQGTYVIYLIGDRSIDITDDSPLWWIDVNDAATA